MIAGQQLVPIPRTHFIWTVDVEKANGDLEFKKIRLASLEAQTESMTEMVPDGITIREVIGSNGSIDWRPHRQLGKSAEIASMEFEGGVLTEVSHPDFENPIKAIFESDSVQIFVSGDDVMCRLKSILKNRKSLEFLVR